MFLKERTKAFLSKSRDELDSRQSPLTLHPVRTPKSLAVPNYDAQQLKPLGQRNLPALLPHPALPPEVPPRRPPLHLPPPRPLAEGHHLPVLTRALALSVGRPTRRYRPAGQLVDGAHLGDGDRGAGVAVPAAGLAGVGLLRPPELGGDVRVRLYVLRRVWYRVIQVGTVVQEACIIQKIFY